MSGEDFWASQGRGDSVEVVNGRYRLPDPLTGEQRDWTRASNVGAVLADRFGLERYHRRQLVRGLAARTDLLDLLKAAVEVDDAKADEVVATALEVAATTAKANQGTAIHEVQRRVDLGLPVPEGMEQWADGYRAALVRARLVPVAVEVLLLNTPLRSCGRGDRLYLEVDAGTLVVGDTKSTDHLQLAVREFAPQMATYATADYLDTRALVGDWRRFSADQMPERPAWAATNEPGGPGFPIRTDYGVAMKVDRETGAVSPYRVDLHLGSHGANVAMQVRAWRTQDGLLLPYVPPVTATTKHQVASMPPAETQRPQLTVVHSSADPAAGAVLGSDVPQNAEQAYVAESRHEPPDAPRRVDVLRTRTDLERKRVSKAEVQQYCRAHGLTDLAHNKPQLLDALERAGKLASAGLQTNTPRSGDSAELVGPVGGEDPTDPRSDAYRRARLAEIGAARTVGELWTIRQGIVKLGGDQAWTDEFTEVARTRVAALDEAVSVPAVADMIRRCVKPKDVADLWERVTVGGTLPERWSADLDQAARQRLEQIRQSTPPAPANPFAGGA